MAFPHITSILQCLVLLTMQANETTNSVACRGGRGAGDSLREEFQTVDGSRATDRPLTSQSRISKVISNKLCVLEIDLEIVKALPDKAHKPKRGSISKSPDIFSSGGTTRLCIATHSTDRAYADVSVGISVGTYEMHTPKKHT